MKNSRQYYAHNNVQQIGGSNIDPQIRFGGGHTDWKWLDRSVQSDRNNNNNKMAMMMMNMKTGEIDFEFFYCDVAATAAEREPARQQTQQQHMMLPPHTNRMWWTGGSWEEEKVFCFFLFSRWPGYVCGHTKNRFVRDWWFSVFSHLQSIAIKGLRTCLIPFHFV